jgi:hypothetical protein
VFLIPSSVFETGFTDIAFIGSAFLVRQVRKFQGRQAVTCDEGRARGQRTPRRVILFVRIYLLCENGSRMLKAVPLPTSLCRSI